MIRRKLKEEGGHSGQKKQSRKGSREAKEHLFGKRQAARCGHRREWAQEGRTQLERPLMEPIHRTLHAMQMSFDFIMNYGEPQGDFNLENSWLDLCYRKKSRPEWQKEFIWGRIKTTVRKKSTSCKSVKVQMKRKGSTKTKTSDKILQLWSWERKDPKIEHFLRLEIMPLILP